MQMILLPLHLLTLIVTIICIITADHYGFNWIRGKVKTLDQNKLSKLHKYINIGLITMIITGALLAASNWSNYTDNSAFYLKMLFVVLLVINSIFIGKLMQTAITTEYKAVAKSIKRKMIISAFVSTFSWILAIVFAFNLENESSAPLPIVANQSSKKEMYMNEVLLHNTESDCYTAINNNVYDITKYIPYHPGGKNTILKVCGNDGTKLFTGKHGNDKKPNIILRGMQVGVLK